MTTPDRPRRGAAEPGHPTNLGTTLVPEEHRLALGVLPTPGATPSTAGPTPGLAMAAARIPGGPTLPDWDPASLSRLATAMFSAPSGTVPLHAPSMTAVPTTSTGPGGAPSGADGSGFPAGSNDEWQRGSFETATASRHLAATGPGASASPITQGDAFPLLTSAGEQVPAGGAYGGVPAMATHDGALPSTSDHGGPDRVRPTGADRATSPEANGLPGRSSAPNTSGLSSAWSSSRDAPSRGASPPSRSSSAPPHESPFVAPLSFASLADPFAYVTSYPLIVNAENAPTGDVPGAGSFPRDDHRVDPPGPHSSDAVAASRASHTSELPGANDITSGPSAVRAPGSSSGGEGTRASRELFDPYAIRREFPILDERIHGKQLVWLDNAATTHKPRAVIDRLTAFYEHENSNVHRAAHTLAARASDAYERSRATVARFINAPSPGEVVFVRGATEGINLVAQSWGRRHIQEGDEIVITWLEHHANIVPWHQLCAEKGAHLRVAPVDDRGHIIIEEYEKLLGPKTRLVSLTQVSNALGTLTPAREMIELAHRHGAKVLLDGAQAMSHMRVDVQELDCDFFVFSGHKVFAPTGIGALFGKRSLLEAMPPWQGGGNMIEDVTFERIRYQPPPARFEAGTGNIADAVGLGAALDWLSRIGVETVGRYEHELLGYARTHLVTVPGLRLIGSSPDNAGVISFILAGKKTEEVGGMLDREGIAVRSGHHCAQPILRRFGLDATVRASLAPYNTFEDIDALVSALHRIQLGHGALS